MMTNNDMTEARDTMTGLMALAVWFVLLFFGLPFLMGCAAEMTPEPEPVDAVAVVDTEWPEYVYVPTDVERCVEVCDSYQTDEELGPNVLRCSRIHTNVDCETFCEIRFRDAVSNACEDLVQELVTCEDMSMSESVCMDCQEIREDLGLCVRTGQQACTEITYPSHNGDIKACSWVQDNLCSVGADYNEDGTVDTQDLADLCAENGDSLTMDRDGVGGPWCYTCD